MAEDGNGRSPFKAIQWMEKDTAATQNSDIATVQMKNNYLKAIVMKVERRMSGCFLSLYREKVFYTI